MALSDPPNSLWKLNLITQIICMTVSGIAFLLRCYVRLGYSRLPRQWMIEDWMVSVSFIGLLTFSTLISLMANHRAGTHIDNLNESQIANIRWYFWVITIVYGPVVLGVKLSILLLYRRLLVTCRFSKLWFVIYSIAGICAAFYTSNMFVRIWACAPMERAWRKDVQGRCIDAMISLQISGIFNIVSDAAIILVPVVVSWNLKMHWHKRVGACAVLTFGTVAPVVSAVGFHMRRQAARGTDTTYIILQLQLCVVAEITVGLICVCLPVLPILVRRPRSTPEPGTFDASLAFTDLPRSKVRDPDEALLHSPVTPFKTLESELTPIRSKPRAREERNTLDRSSQDSVQSSSASTRGLVNFLDAYGRLDDDRDRRRSSQRGGRPARSLMGTTYVAPYMPGADHS